MGRNIKTFFNFLADEQPAIRKYYLTKMSKK